MGELISLAERRAARAEAHAPPTRPRASFFFDLASPWTYLAAEHGRAAEFVLAASRLAFCGGYDVDDPEILAEAAAAADLGLDECLRAAGELRRDGPMEQAALRLLAQGADVLPVIVVGRTLFCGEHRLPEAAAAFSGRRAAPPPARRTFGG